MPGLALLALSLPFAQEPERQEREPSPSAVRAWTDQEASRAVEQLRKVRSRRNATLGDKLEAVRALGQGRHRLAVDALADVVRKEPAVSVRAAAAELLGAQPAEAARPVILALIDACDHQPDVLTVLLGALTRAGYQTRDWDRIERLFAREFGEEWTPMQKALLQLVTAHKERQAWRLLVEHLDEPFPADIDHADNPPAEYWERRWKAWRSWRDDVKAALFAITGQRFSTGAEAKVWIRANGAKAGLR